MKCYPGLYRSVISSCYLRKLNSTMPDIFPKIFWRCVLFGAQNHIQQHGWWTIYWIRILVYRLVIVASVSIQCHSRIHIYPVDREHYTTCNNLEYWTDQVTNKAFSGIITINRYTHMNTLVIDKHTDNTLQFCRTLNDSRQTVIKRFSYIPTTFIKITKIIIPRGIFFVLQTDR